MSAIEDAGMTDEEKVIYILRRSFHETPNDRAMAHIARNVVDAIKEPRTDEVKAAAEVIYDRIVGGPALRASTMCRYEDIARAALEAARAV